MSFIVINAAAIFIQRRIQLIDDERVRGGRSFIVINDMGGFYQELGG